MIVHVLRLFGSFSKSIRQRKEDCLSEILVNVSRNSENDVCANGNLYILMGLLLDE